jgi:integrase
LRGFVADGHVYKATVTQAWIKKLWRWAAEKDLVTAPIMEAVRLDYEKRERDRVYDDAEILATWEAADQLDRSLGVFAKLMILLAPRKTALAAMTWDHLDDPDNPTKWTTPFELTKSRKSTSKKRVYVTPLPPLAQHLIKSLPKGTERLFPELVVRQTAADQPRFFGVELQRQLIRFGAPKDFAYHCWRHTVASWLHNKGVDEWGRALVLNHSGGGSVTAGYSHGYPLELKLKLLTEWSEHVAGLLPSDHPDRQGIAETAGNVIDFPKTKVG